jgi:deoxycytidylate deaminase
MSYLINDSEGMFYLEECARIAMKSSCHRSRCGSVIVSNSQIIGSGFNSMPCNLSGSCFKDSLDPNFKSDKTCCVHAEQRAIFDALRSYPDKLPGSRLYFIRVDENGNMKRSGDPYCTICSKMALDNEISEFVLYHKNGITVYDTTEYNDLSFKYINEK